MNLEAGQKFPDLDLPDHTGRPRRLSELAGGDPVALLFSCGWWCPKEQRHLREVTALQNEFEVAPGSSWSASTRRRCSRPSAPAWARASRSSQTPGALLGDALICLSTLAVDEARYAGAITVTRRPAPWSEDPFARIFPGTVVRSDRFCPVAPPPGSVLERYAGVAWPGGTFKDWSGGGQGNPARPRA